MPLWLHRQLNRQADKLSRKGKLKDREAYVYGTMQKYAEQKRDKARREKAGGLRAYRQRAYRQR